VRSYPAAIPAIPEPVPHELPDATARGPIHQVAPERIQLGVPGVGRVLLRAHGAASFDLGAGATEDDAAWLLGGPARQARRILGGRFALAGAGVTIGGRAVALVGRGASGKSVAAAALARRGHPVLADSALEVDAGGERPRALPTTAAPELWPDVLGLLGLSEDEGETVRPALRKRAYGFDAGSEAPLHAVVVLKRGSDNGETTIRRLPGGQALSIVLQATAMWPLVLPVGVGPQHFAWAVAIAGAASAAIVVSDRFDENVEAVADAVEEVAA
jgi:hypothetical protein